ncbi:MAG: hypothetical protein HDR23_07425 [Lachnospiraceae bacterium]|nr:hypothetical protein [Lachnospiraceae bacterium]
MHKMIVSITAVIIILILLLASYLWYKCCVPSSSNDVLYVMHISRSRLVIIIPGIIFFLIMDILSLINLDSQFFVAFVVFYLFMLLNIYSCTLTLLWRGMIREDSLTTYTLFLPAKEIRFYEIDFVHYKDNHTLGLSGQKTLVGYRDRKKIFSIEEDVYGFQLLCALLCKRNKVDYAPVMENPETERTMPHVPLVEDFSVALKTEDKIRSWFSFPLILLFFYFLFQPAESTWVLFLQIASVCLLLLFIQDLFHALFWKVTVDFHTISIRKFPGMVKTYEIRQITKVDELEHFIVLYAGQKKIAKIAKTDKNFQNLFERLLRSDAEIYRKK